MPRKAMKCVVELDVHVVTCPGTFLRDYEYIYLNVEMLGLQAKSKSVTPTFPLFFHERIRFERTFQDCTDPSLVAAMLKGEDVILELRQHTDYVTDGKVLAHCSSNSYDFLYPAIPSYYGSGREILLYKTSKFKPIRITGEPVKVEFSTKTTIKEINDHGYDSGGSDTDDAIITKGFHRSRSQYSSSMLRSRSLSPTRRLTSTRIEPKEQFVVRRKDDNALSNRDFSSFDRPKTPRRSKSPSRRRSASPSRTYGLGNSTVEPIPGWMTGSSTPRSHSHRAGRHSRSVTTPAFRSTSPTRSLRYALDDLDVGQRSSSYTDPVLRFKSRHSPNLKAALNASGRIQHRVEEILRKKDDSVDESEEDSDVTLDVLRESLRAERRALGEAIREADREAFYRTITR